MLAIPREIENGEHIIYAIHPPDGTPFERLDCRLERKKAVLLEALEQAKEPTLPELLFRYLEQRSGERADWTSRGKPIIKLYGESDLWYDNSASLTLLP